MRPDGAEGLRDVFPQWPGNLRCWQERGTPLNVLGGWSIPRCKSLVHNGGMKSVPADNPHKWVPNHPPLGFLGARKIKRAVKQHLTNGKRCFTVS
jgi:hypothetical protein